jgi:hypothetical protein
MEIAIMIQSKYIAAIAATLQLISFLGLETTFAAATVAFVGTLMALVE